MALALVVENLPPPSAAMCLVCSLRFLAVLFGVIHLIEVGVQFFCYIDIVFFSWLDLDLHAMFCSVFLFAVVLLIGFD